MFSGNFQKFQIFCFFSKEKSDFPSMIFEKNWNFENFPKIYFFIFKVKIFVEKQISWEKIELSFRCRILSGIHFWHRKMQRDTLDRCIMRLKKVCHFFVKKQISRPWGRSTSEILCAVTLIYSRCWTKKYVVRIAEYCEICTLKINW